MSNETTTVSIDVPEEVKEFVDKRLAEKGFVYWKEVYDFWFGRSKHEDYIDFKDIITDGSK